MSEEESKTAKNGEKEAEFAENEGEADPRVQEELEKLNQAGSEINDLETKLTQARNDYRTTLHVSFYYYFYFKNKKNWPFFMKNQFSL